MKIFTLKKSLKTIGRKLIISNSNKIQPLLNTSKAWWTIPAGSLREWKPSKTHTKNTLSLISEVYELFCSETKNLKQLHSKKTIFKT